MIHAANNIDDEKGIAWIGFLFLCMHVVLDPFL